MRYLIVIALSMLLAGCFSLTAPKPIPEWAMNPQAENVAEPQAKPRRSVAARRPAVHVVEQTGTVSDAPTNVEPAALGRAVVGA
jgi:hypothetical protein